MTEEEVEIVAEELAKVGGTSWYPGRSRGPLLRPISARYRDRARVAIAALDRLRARGFTGAALELNEHRSARGLSDQRTELGGELRVGAIVVYRPANDKRAISCKIEKLEGGRAYLIPCPLPDVGWVDVDGLIGAAPHGSPQNDQPS